MVTSEAGRGAAVLTGIKTNRLVRCVVVDVRAGMPC